MIVSHPEAIFGVFCRRFGIPLIDGGTIRLAKVIGINRARDLILTGRELKGNEAFEWGLVNRLVEKVNVL
jgi:enoyl-CoA hydratase